MNLGEKHSFCQKKSRKQNWITYSEKDQFPDDQACYAKKGKKVGRKAGKKNNDSFMSSKNRKTTKREALFSFGKGRLAGSLLGDEHDDACLLET